MRAWLYYRLSRDEDEELNSLTNQRSIIAGYAEKNGFTIAGESFDDNVSGMHFDRDGIEKICEAVEQNQIDAVIVKDDCVIKALTPQTLENRHFSGIGTEFRAIWRPQRAAHIIGTS